MAFWFNSYLLVLDINNNNNNYNIYRALNTDVSKRYNQIDKQIGFKLRFESVQWRSSLNVGG